MSAKVAATYLLLMKNKCEQKVIKGRKRERGEKEEEEKIFFLPEKNFFFRFFVIQKFSK